MSVPGGPVNRLLRAGYGALLRCMPRSFRQRHAEEIEHTLTDRASGASGVHLGLGAAADLVRGLVAEWGRTARDFASVDIGRDLRSAVRGLRRTPGFTLLAVAALALGMGANASVFSLVHEILLRPLPVQQPDRLVNIYLDQPGANSFTGFSWPEYLDYRAANRDLEGIAALSGAGLRYGDGGTDVRVGAAMVSDNYFDVLGVEAARGRLFGGAEVEEGAAVAVIGHGFWQRRLGGAEGVVGSTIRLNDLEFTVIGVTPAGFSGTFIGFPTELWVPVTLIERLRPGIHIESREQQPLELFGRLAPGGTVAAADAALDAVAAELEAGYPLLYRDRRVKVFPMTGIDQSMYQGVVGFVGVLLALSGLVLVTACLNVGGMLLARGSYRAREMAVRLALGASRWRLARQVLVEAGVLFGLGTLVAVLLAVQLNAVLRRFIEALPVPVGFELQLDPRVLGVTAIVGLTTALLTGLSPALRVSDARPGAAWRAGSRQTGGSQSIRGAFLVGQVALSLVLLVSAGLFVRAAWRGARLDPGFAVEALSVTTIGLPAERYSDAAAVRLFADLSTRLESSSLVDGASFSALPAIDVARSVATARVPGLIDEDGDDQVVVDVNAIGTDFFSVIGLPLLAGRGFEPADQRAMRQVAVVNRTAADTFWPGSPAVGRDLTLEDTPVAVVGVVEDSRTVIQDSTSTPLIYVPAGQRPARRMSVVLRSDAEPGAISRVVRRELAALDGTLTPPTVRPLADIIELSMLPQRLVGRFAGGLGALALVLALCGVYGIVAYTVGQRRRELGIRVALGGAPAGVVLLVMRSGLGLVLIGLALGSLGIVALTPLLRGFLLDVAPFDPIALGAAAALTLAASALASWLPARRAARIDPAITLRAD